jgi:hypothetical protein
MNTASFTRKLTIAASLCVAFASTGCVASSEEDLDEGPKAEEGEYESNEEFIESNQALAASGSVTATSNALLNNVVNAAEWPWRVRTFHYDPDPVVPRRMYFSSCKTATDSPKMFVSMTVANPNTPVTKPKETTGLLMKFSYNVTTKTYSRDASVSFPGCSEALGVATSNDCSVVGMLCRRPWGSPNPTKDLVAAIPDQGFRDWITQPGSPATPNDELWLYEWNQPDVKTTPKKYVVDKAIGGGWEYGSQYLIYAEQEKKWGISIKATVGTSPAHQGDSFLVVDRNTMSINTNRGWLWECGTGHTLFNHPAYDPVSSKFAAMCGTDYNSAETGYLGAQVVHVEGQPNREFWHYNMIGIRPKGGVGSFLPAPGGGFLGVVTGTATAPSAVQNFPLTPKTAIGFVRTDATGTATQPVKWFGTSGSTYLGHAQLAPLGNGRFLLGYAKFTNPAVDGNGQGGIKDENTFRVPSSYWVFEIDAKGNSLTQPKQIQNGWGEQDQMVPLGNGRVGWAYNPEFWRKGTAAAGYTYPNPRSNNIQINVYTSATN